MQITHNFATLVIDLTLLSAHTGYIFFIKRSLSGSVPVFIQKQEFSTIKIKYR